MTNRPGIDDGDETEEFRVLSTKKIETLPHSEEEYRRAYYDGYVEALNALDDLMTVGKLSADAAHSMLWDHWDSGALYYWRFNLGKNGYQLSAWDYIQPPQVEIPD